MTKTPMSLLAAELFAQLDLRTFRKLLDRDQVTILVRTRVVLAKDVAFDLLKRQIN